MTINIKKHLVWAGGIAGTVAWFVFAEGWLILVVKLFGFWMGAGIVTLATLALSWMVIYFASGARNVGRFSSWLKEQEAELSGKAKATVGGGKVLVTANTAVFLGPMFAAILMLMFGLPRNKTYIYSIPCALLCGFFWSAFYSGIFWGIHEIVAGH